MTTNRNKNLLTYFNFQYLYFQCGALKFRTNGKIEQEKHERGMKIFKLIDTLCPMPIPFLKQGSSENLPSARAHNDMRTVIWYSLLFEKEENWPSSCPVYVRRPQNTNNSKHVSRLCVVLFRITPAFLQLSDYIVSLTVSAQENCHPSRS